jgi:biotin carboxyl carrier protein
MSKQLRVIVNGKPFEVEVGEFFGGSTELKVNGTTYVVDIEDAGGSVPQAVTKTSVAAAPAPVKAAPAAAPAAPVAIAAAGATDVVSAPMPGVILDISVKVGDKVAAGQPVCALEAMKMKNILRSPREGTVASVEVNEGQRVPFGAVIIRFA